MTTDPAVTAAVTRACPWHHRTDCGCRETQVPELVWTVAVAIHALRGYGKPPVCPDCIADAEVAVAAARPIIEAGVRERIAADIGAMTLKQIGMGVSLFDAARDQAARIARGQ